ncbi:DMT family transporter [Oxalobacteraceae bacterium CAVE-383]|nr:DMT family transporter [Oxalobacteraceae bacterium CAVE-383]
MNLHNSSKAIIFAMLCVISWSLIAVISKVGTADISALQLLFLSNVLSALVLGLLVFFLRRSIQDCAKQIKSNAIQTAYLGFLGCFLYYLCLYYGYSKSNAVTVLVVQYLWPILAVLLSPFILREKRSRKTVLIAMLGFIGVVVVATKGEVDPANFENLPVLAAVFIGSLSFALFSVLSKKLICHALVAAFLFFAWAALFSLIAVLFDGGIRFPSSTQAWLSLFVNGVVVNGLSYFWWLRALQLGQVSRIAPLVFLTPILACIWLVLLLDEPFFISYGIGLILCVTAGFMAATNSEKNQESSAAMTSTKPSAPEASA